MPLAQKIADALNGRRVDYVKQVDPKILAKAISLHESGGKQVKGGSGEFGAFQFMPATWKLISKEIAGKVLPQTAENEWNIATQKIDQLLKKFNNNIESVAMVWNTSLAGKEEPIITKGVNSKGIKYDSTKYAAAVAAAYNSLLEPRPEPKKPSLTEKIGNGIKSFFAGPIERYGAVKESIQTRSLAPLKKSFAQQFTAPGSFTYPDDPSFGDRAGQPTPAWVENLAFALSAGNGKVPKKPTKLPTDASATPQQPLAKQIAERLEQVRPTPAPTSAKNPLQPIIPSSDEAIGKVVAALKAAKPLERKQAEIYAKARSQQTARVAAVGKNVKGEAGLYAQLGQLKGELPKVQFESIRKSLSQENVDSLFNRVEDSHLLPLEKVSTKAALAKILGHEGGAVPTRSELAHLNEVFPPEFIQAVMDQRPLLQRIGTIAGEVANIPRSLMATFDVSAPLRQGLFMIGRQKEFAPAFVQMFKYLGSEDAYQAAIQQIKSRPSYKAMRQYGLALTDTDSPILSRHEETFMSNLAEQIPGIGQVVRASSRAYTGFLNKLRADVFDDLYSKAKALGIDERVGDDLAKFVNAGTGRGDLGVFERAAVVLNATFFSPRLLASRLNLINPNFYYKLDPFVRKEALKSLLTLAGVAGTVLSLAKLAGADVETRPQSSDFAKAKFGDTRYDILGGFQQPIRLASQLLSGKVISSTSGRETTLGEGFKPLTRKDIILRFFESKESPVFSFASGLLTGQDNLGRQFNVPKEIAERFIPMVTQDLYDLYQQKGLSGLIMGLPTPFGVGTQTYGKVELAEGKNPLGEDTLQIRPVQGLGDTLIKNIFGEQPLGSSRSFDVQQFHKQLKGMPKEQARELFNSIAEQNPDLAKQLSQAARDEQLGMTPHDYDLKSMGVASGDRALAVQKDLNKAKDKKALFDEYVRKGIITTEIARQLQIIRENQ